MAPENKVPTLTEVNAVIRALDDMTGEVESDTVASVLSWAVNGAEPPPLIQRALARIKNGPPPDIQGNLF